MANRRKLASGYRGVVMSAPGAMLLGGTTKHVSSIFHDGRHATRWTVIVAQTNKDAGRKVGDLFVQRIERGIVVETYR